RRGVMADVSRAVAWACSNTGSCVAPPAPLVAIGDPDMAGVALHPAIEAQKDLVPIPDIDASVLPVLRETPLTAPVELSDRVDRRDYVVSETPRVVVRVHRPKEVAGALPCVYSIHGGGYILGNYEMDDAKFDVWCQKFGLVGVSVENRLAPETPYPGPLEACYARLQWTYDHALEIGVDRNQIGITGVSAGGGLCAGLALLARDRGDVPVHFQLLDCPMLDDRQETASSQLEELVVWSKASNAFGWRSYLGPCTAPATSQRMEPRPEPRILPACPRRTCVSVGPTASVTRTSPTPCACTARASRQSSMSTPARPMASPCGPRPSWPSVTSATSRIGWAANCRA